MELHCTVNDETVVLTISPGDRLLDVLRDRLGLTGTKKACARGECGACTVLVGGRAVNSCVILASTLRPEQAVQTVEGLAEEALPLRRAFADEAAFQCGFCTPGQIVNGVALLRKGLPESDAELRHCLSGNICRCTGYISILRALRAAADVSEGQ
jgi:aerobic-type carbon monoxide dehydrogenase small subunit (CoxS/CutS family)